MRHAVTALVLVALVGVVRPLRADPAATFLTRARSAIGDPATLSTVHSLYQLVTVTPLGSVWGLPSVEGSMSASGTPRSIASWIVPPSRYLVRSGPYKSGIDVDHFIGAVPASHIELTNRLRHWALVLLLYDPTALGVTVTDRGTSVADHKALHMLDASADGFEMRLYFDPRSYRLVMSEDSNEATHVSVPSEPTFGGMPSPPPVPIPGSTRRVAERETYGSYRQVRGIELPFSIIRTHQGGKTGGTATLALNVVKYVINPGDLNQQFAR